MFSDVTDLLQQFLEAVDDRDMLIVLNFLATKSGVILPDRRKQALARELSSFLSQSIQRTQAQQRIFNQLTDREIDVLKLIGCGLSNHAISDRLGIKERTVRQHIENMQCKLEVQGRGMLIARAYALEILCNASA